MDQILLTSRIYLQADLDDQNEKSKPQDIDIDANAPIELVDKSVEIILEPMDKNPYDVSYTCLLLPKLGSHLLLEDISLHLQTNMKEICASFGWRLEFLSVEPNYLHWTMRVQPATSVSHFIRVIREKTSLKMFADFPRFKRENQSGDFWAPGYLIIWGLQPHPIEIIQRFIRQTRQQQGIRTDE